MDSSDLPQRVDGLLVERTVNELLVFNDISAEAFALNETSAIVYDLCDGSTSIADMVPRLAEATGLPADQGVVELAIEELVDAGLIELEASGPPAIGRRSLITKLGLTAAAAAALPLVESVVTVTDQAGAQVPVPTPRPTPGPTPGPTPAPTPGPTPDPDPGPRSGPRCRRPRCRRPGCRRRRRGSPAGRRRGRGPGERPPRLHRLTPTVDRSHP
jgi:hypothetical protein